MEGIVSMATPSFDRRDAFSRNIGWMTEWEQQQLRGIRIAIAGMGGVGGSHLVTLARLGVGKFHIADLDQFEIANFNRQIGASLATVGRDKASVMAEMARGINPELDITVFDQGVSEDNIDAFLDGVDLFVDGFDFFVLDIRRAVFKRCAERGIPAITAAPVGFGAAYIVFMPGKMTFEQLFRLDGLPEMRQYVNFASALTPAGFHRSYLVDSSRLDLAGKRGPSTAVAINLCAGVVGAEAVKIVLGRGGIKAAPWVHQFDAFRSRWRSSYLPFGNAGPLQSLKRMIGYRVFSTLSRNARPVEPACTGSDIERILDAARWSPSGDNSQPWRFEITGEDGVIVHVTSKDDDIYDFGGRPTLLSTGMLLETMRIAASEFGRKLDWRYLGGEGRTHRIACDLPRADATVPDPLSPYVRIRSVDRRPFRLGGLTAAHKEELSAAVGDEFDIVWHEGFSARFSESRTNMLSTAIRLALPAAHRVHLRVIDWVSRFSREGVPAAAIGLDALTLAIMRWTMKPEVLEKSWSRMKFLNRYLAGSVGPQVQLDLAPGLLCAAHYSLWRRGAADHNDPAAQLRAGQAVQRFWLTLTRLGMVMQPAIAPIIFSWYGRHPDEADADTRTVNGAKALNRRLFADGIRDPESLVYRGRVGRPIVRAAASRSIRRHLPDILVR